MNGFILTLALSWPTVRAKWLHSRACADLPVVDSVVLNGQPSPTLAIPVQHSGESRIACYPTLSATALASS